MTIPKTDVFIQGGEVGLLPIDIMRHLLITLDRKIVISTNGVFMKNNYHKDKLIRPYVDQIYWHLSENCNNIVEDIHDEEIPIIRGIVYTNDEDKDWFLSNNSNLDIEYQEPEIAIESKCITEPNVDIDKCRQYSSCILIDLVNERLCLCIKNFSDVHIPLTYDNLKKLVMTFPGNVFDLPSINNSNCSSCIRLSKYRYNKDIIKEKLKLRQAFMEVGL